MFKMVIQYNYWAKKKVLVAVSQEINYESMKVCFFICREIKNACVSLKIVEILNKKAIKVRKLIEDRRIKSTR